MPIPLQSLRAQARLTLGRARRASLGMVRRSALYRWRRKTTPGEQLLLVPQDLRTTDPSFLGELEADYMGLGGAVAPLEGGSPFDLAPPSAAWEEELHDFSWLRHLAAAPEPEKGRRMARALVADWIARQRFATGVAWQPAIAARRLISWLAHANLILEPDDAKAYDAVMRQFNRMLVHLVDACDDCPDPAERLLTLIATAYGALCIADQESLLDEYAGRLGAELEEQILEDGGHASRNPGETIELLLDLLPLKQCFVARNRAPPEALGRVISRAIPMLRYMRLGDGSIARFNGMGATWPDRLATVLAYDEQMGGLLHAAPQSRYERLQRRNTVLVMDGGAPPPLALSTRAHAGCLSFEMSVGHHLFVVNCGAPGPADRGWLQMARGTAAHSTLTINNTSSSRLVRGANLEEQFGTPAITGPGRVEVRREEQDDGAVVLRAFHDGYVGRYGLTHERTLRLGPLGDRLDGIDRLISARALIGNRGPAEAALAIHFHIHPRVAVRRAPVAGGIDLKLPNGEAWRFFCDAIEPSLEESVFLAELSGPLQAVQIVLRATTAQIREVRWRFERMLPTTEDRRRALEERFSVIEGWAGNEDVAPEIERTAGDGDGNDGNAGAGGAGGAGGGRTDEGRGTDNGDGSDSGGGDGTGGGHGPESQRD